MAIERFPSSQIVVRTAAHQHFHRPSCFLSLEVDPGDFDSTVYVINQLRPIARHRQHRHFSTFFKNKLIYSIFKFIFNYLHLKFQLDNMSRLRFN